MRFLAKIDQPTPQVNLKRCAETTNPVINNAVPVVALPRTVRLLSAYVGMWKSIATARTPSTGAQTTGFLIAFHAEVQTRVVGERDLPSTVLLSSIARVMGETVMEPIAMATATLTTASLP